MRVLLNSHLKRDSTYFIRRYFKLGYMIPIFKCTLKPLSVLSLYISFAHSLSLPCWVTSGHIYQIKAVDLQQKAVNRVHFLFEDFFFASWHKQLVCTCDIGIFRGLRYRMIQQDMADGQSLRRHRKRFVQCTENVVGCVCF